MRLAVVLLSFLALASVQGRKQTLLQEQLADAAPELITTSGVKVATTQVASLIFPFATWHLTYCWKLQFVLTLEKCSSLRRVMPLTTFRSHPPLR
jgi:hypothetical protein